MAERHATLTHGHEVPSLYRRLRAVSKRYGLVRDRASYSAIDLVTQRRFQEYGLIEMPSNILREAGSVRGLTDVMSGADGVL
jgi:hypothetical protein